MRAPTTIRQITAAGLAAAAFLCGAGNSAASPTYGFWPSPINGGLPDPAVRVVYQDSKGTIWAATLEGLVSYNGKEVIAEPHSDDLSGFGTITDLAETEDGRLWVASSGGLHTHKVYGLQDSVASVLPDDVQDIRDLHSDSNLLWLRHAGGLSVLDTERDDAVQTVQLSATAIAGAGDGDVYVALSSGEIVKASYDAGITTAPLLSLPQGQTSTYLAGDGGLLWIATNTGSLYRASTLTSSGALIEVPTGSAANQLPNTVIRKLYAVDQRIFVGTTEGLAISSDAGETWTLYDKFSAGLTDDVVDDFWLSRDGVLWVATSNGVTQGIDRHYQILSTNNCGINNDYVSAVIEMGDQLLVGTDAGLDILDSDCSSLRRINSVAFSEMADDVVTALAVDDDQRFIWIGTFSGGAYRYSFETAELLPIPLAEGEVSVTAIDRLASDTTIISTWGSGVFRLQGDQVSPLAGPERVSTTAVMPSGLVLAADGGFWLVEPIVADAQKIDIRPTGFPKSQDWPSDITLSITDSGRGFWYVVVANTGIYRWVPGNALLQDISSEMGLPSNNVTAMVRRDNGEIWLTQNEGLSILDPDGGVTNIQTRLGQQNTDFVLNAFDQGDSGKLYFGSTAGLVVIDPQNRPPPIKPTQVALSQIAILGVPVELSQGWQKTPIVLDVDDDIVNIDFFAAEYLNPGSITYQYRIRGLGEETPIPLLFDNNVNLTTLRPGDYTVEVAARGASGEWNWSLKVPLRQLAPPPPWYQTTWFFVSLAAGVLLAIFGVYAVQNIRLRQSRERSRELAQAVRERTAELEKANAAKTDFLATMSHELRTPINGIIGLTSLVQDEAGLSPRAQRFLDQSQGAAKTLLGLVNDTLDLAKIEAGEVDLETLEFSVMETVGSVVYLQSEAASQKGLELVLYITGEVSSLHRGDSQKLWQILTNLISNAIKFTEQGGVLVMVTSVDTGITINIVDSGIGVHGDAREKIFQEYTQAEASTTRRFGGTGLGLSISRRFAEAMGGSLTLEENDSQLFASGGPGSNFQLHVPLIPVAAQQPVAEPKAISLVTGSQLIAMGSRSICAWLGHHLDVVVPESCDTEALEEYVIVDEACPQSVIEAIDARADVKKYLLAGVRSTHPFTRNLHWQVLFKPVIAETFALEDLTEKADPGNKNQYTGRVLVCEDNAVNAMLFEEILVQAGLSFVVAGNGEIGVAEFKRQEFNLVLMDLQMPTLDGFEATERIRSYETKRGRDPVPIIAMSAGVSTSERDRALAVGITEFVPKPANLATYDRIFSTYLLSNPDTSEGAGVVIDETHAEDQVNDLVDVQALETIKGMSPTAMTLFPKLLNQYDIQAEKTLASLKDAIEQQDADAVRRVAHAMKSTSANLGAIQLTEMLAAMEADARDNDQCPEGAILEPLQACIASSKAAIEDWLSKNNN